MVKKKKFKHTCCERINAEDTVDYHQDSWQKQENILSIPKIGAVDMYL